MDFDITSVKITGIPGAGGWAQVHDFKPSDEDKLKARGHIFAVIATSGGEYENSNLSSGREILTRLHEEYFGNLKTSAFYALKEAVEKVISEFSLLPEENIEIAASSFVDGILYTSCAGGSQAMILRNNSLAKILISHKAKTVSASGYPKVGDIFLLATSNFFQAFKEGVIKANLQSSSIEKAKENFAGTIHSLTNSSSLAGVIISFTKGLRLPIPDLTKAEKEESLVSKPVFIKPKLSGFIDSLINKFPRRLYIRRSEIDIKEERNKKTIFSVGIILLLLLCISIGFGIKQKKNKEFRSTYQKSLDEAVYNFEESTKLFSLNPARARELFFESKKTVEELVIKGIKDPALLELKTKIEENEGSLLGEYKQKAELYLDLTLLTSSFKAEKMASSSSNIVVLDNIGKKIVEITINNKKSRVVAGPDQIEGVKDLTIYSDRVFILTNEGIWEVGNKKNKLIEKDWKDNSYIYAYAGNIYLLEMDTNNIYRFPGVGESFANKQNWLSEVKTDFSDFSSWTIDGSIWIAKSTSHIYKFSQGVRQGFEVKGVSPTLGQIDSIYSNEELKYLYILDRSYSRVVVINKEGEFKAQYKDEMLKTSKSISVSEKDKKIIFLNEDSKLYFLEIKHL